MTVSNHSQDSLSLDPVNKPSSLISTFRNLKIGQKLTVGFGLLVALTLVVVGLSYQGSTRATTVIDRTGEVRAPITLASANARANLLRMLASTRGYLSLADPAFIDEYYAAEAAFESDLARLQALSADDPDEMNRFRLNAVQEAFIDWKELPAELFALRDDRLAREPAYEALMTDGIRSAGSVLLDIKTMIELQEQQEATPENLDLLEDMAAFQGSFASMLSGLRNYVTTQNGIFRGEYEDNLSSNEIAWDRLEGKRSLLTSEQVGLLIEINRNRADFLRLPDDVIFPILQGPRSREDLYLFETEAIPLNNTMVSLLDEITEDQQQFLSSDLDRGRASLKSANQQTLLFGLAALALGLVMSYGLQQAIAGPIRRLTSVAEVIRAGDLEAQAKVESQDEVGILAQTFNRMTTQLRATLRQVRKEKNRADSLLNVVIPIGVDLSSEKDFNRLLEKMLVEAKMFCRANGGILYLRTDDDQLQYVIVRDDRRDIVLGGTSGKKVPYDALPMFDDDEQPNREFVAVETALQSRTLNIADATKEQYNFASPDGEIEYQANASLSIPLVNSQDEVVGVMQLLDPQDPDSGQVIPFDQNLQQMMESFSSLAVAALEAYRREQALRQEIQQLRIEIDASKKEQQVEEIIETDFFRDLQAKARKLRSRRHEK